MLFWAAVKIISQHVGYTERNKNVVRVPSYKEIVDTFSTLKFRASYLEQEGKPSEYAEDLMSYFRFRADVLNTYVEPRLMDLRKAKANFEKLYGEINPKCPIPMNKQKGDKKSPAYFTSIINMIIEKNSNGHECDYDPRELTSITRDGKPIRTLSRRVDGAFPSAINPIAIWEIKEYYYTTTFGSRVADGVYETLLDGMELKELFEHENIKINHYLMVDAYYTWWDCGKSYLSRIIDMLHMGFVDEVLFGYEVIERLPSIVKEWMR